MSFLIRQTLIYAMPLMVVALAGIFAERSGIINLALEGIMIFGAFIGVLFVRMLQAQGLFDEAKASGSWMTLQGYLLLAMLVAALLGAVFSLLLAFAAINLRADQTIGGTALNMFAPAFSIVLTWAILGQGQTTMTLPKWVRITQETVGGLNCHQMVGISFWSEADGGKLAGDLDEVYRSPGGKERYWEQVPLVYKKENYSVHVRECSFEDITEIDTFNELKQIDKLYAT